MKKMKNIAVWKVVLLTLITGGLYAIFWAGRNRDYLAKQKGVTQKLPRWAWLLLIPILFGMTLVGMIAVLFAGSNGVITAEATSLWPLLITLLGELAVLFVGLWWLWYFGEAFAKATQGRISRTVTLVLFFFIGPLVIAFQQYYINRLDQNKKGAVYKSGPGLVLLTCCFVLLSSLATVVSIYSIPASVQDIKTTTLNDQTELQEVNRLEKKYGLCVENLDRTYPGEEVQPGQEEAYIEASDACDAIYKEYRAAFDAYMAE